MTTPAPVLPYGVRQKRRDYIGIASLPLAVFDLGWFIGGVPIANPFLDNLVGIVLALWPIGIALAVIGVALMRGKSIAGWAALAMYAAIVMLRLSGLR